MYAGYHTIIIVIAYVLTCCEFYIVVYSCVDLVPYLRTCPSMLCKRCWNMCTVDTVEVQHKGIKVIMGIQRKGSEQCVTGNMM